MKIQIRSFAMIREIIGDQRIEFETDKHHINSIILELITKYPDLGEYLVRDEILNPNFVYAIDGTRLDNNQLDEVTITENQELVIIPPAGGG